MSLLQDCSISIANALEILQSCINSSPPSAAYMRQWTGPVLVQVMTCRLFGAKQAWSQMHIYIWLLSDNVFELYRNQIRAYLLFVFDWK